MKIVIEKNAEMKSRDGCVLRANIYRPDDDERHPVLLARTPYGKDAEGGPPVVSPFAAVAAGYVFVLQDVRASGASDGEAFFPHRHEGADGYDAVEWAASLPYADGTVGALGLSYLAGTAWQAAAEAPPSLRAIMPIQGPLDFYDVWWRGGALRLTDLVGWMLMMRFMEAAPSREGKTVNLLEIVDAIDDLERWVRHVPLTSLPPVPPESPAFEILRHPVPDDWTTSIIQGHRDVRVPALIVSSWYDRLLTSHLLQYTQMRTAAASEVAREQTRLIIGPWGHGEFRSSFGELDFGLRATGGSNDLRESLSALQLKWFDQWLRATRHDSFDTPRVWTFVQGVNRWRHDADWPPAAATPVAWYLGPSGRLECNTPPPDAAPDSYVYDPHDPCPTHGGSALMLPARYARGPAEQAPILARRDVLAYTSAPLNADLQIIGPITAVLYASTSGRDTDWVVKLCDVHPDGRTLSVTDGLLRARYRQGLDQPVLVQPDAVQRYEVELDPTAMVFLAGHRLRIIVTSSDFPRHDRNPNTGELSVATEHFEPARQMIFHDASRASHLLLPTMS